MSRGFTARHAYTVGDLGFAVQFNAGTLWHYDLQTTRDDTKLPPAIILKIQLFLNYFYNSYMTVIYNF